VSEGCSFIAWGATFVAAFDSNQQCILAAVLFLLLLAAVFLYRRRRTPDADDCEAQLPSRNGRID